jgi:hypothetical protein
VWLFLNSAFDNPKALKTIILNDTKKRELYSVFITPTLSLKSGVLTLSWLICKCII